MIDLHGDISIPFLKKSRFTGSYHGMRYVILKREKTVEEAVGDTPAKTETVMAAVIWPEPMNFEHTPDDKKHDKEFSFNKEGLDEAIAWLNAEYEAGHF
jgi:hypothetical protein